MSFPNNNNMMPTLGGGAGGGAGNNNNSMRRGSHTMNHLSSLHHPAPATTHNKANSNPTSVDAMFQGILPGGGAMANSLSPSNPRQHLSGLHFGSTTGNNTAGGGLLLLGMGGGSLSGSNNSRHVHQGADPSHLAVTHQQQQQQQLTALRRNSELSEEIKRLQQLHQLTSASASVGLSNDQLLQNYLAATTSSSSTNTNTTTNASSRDAAAATHLLMAQQLQKQQQQQQQQALQQQQQQQALQQQQVQALQQQLGMASTTPGGGASLVAQLMAAGGGAGGGAGTAVANMSAFHNPPFRTNNQTTTTMYQSFLPSPSMLSARGSAAMIGSRPGQGAIEPFPEKLHRMLTEVELSGKSHIISFVDDGRAFAIHKPSHFFKEVVPLYFRQSRLSSFKRQLNLYGFELISNGPSRGAYFHELFQKDKPSLCRRMRRVAVKVGSKNSSSKQHQEDAQEKEGPLEDAKKVEKEAPPERPSANED